MPYISFKTNHKLTLRQENIIRQETGKLIELLPGKSESSLMIHMEDDQIMYFKGQEMTCMMIHVNLYGKVDFESKKDFVESLIIMISETTRIHPDNIYVTIREHEHWGFNHTLY